MFSYLISGLVAFCACDSPDQKKTKDPNISRHRQAITDTDSDGMDDDWETTHFGDLSRDGTGDYDSDDITDLDEYLNS